MEYIVIIKIIYIKVSLKKERNVVWEKWYLKTELIIWDNFYKINFKAKVSILTNKGLYLLEYLKKV